MESVKAYGSRMRDLSTPTHGVLNHTSKIQTSNEVEMNWTFVRVFNPRRNLVVFTCEVGCKSFNDYIKVIIELRQQYSDCRIDTNLSKDSTGLIRKDLILNYTHALKAYELFSSEQVTESLLRCLVYSDDYFKDFIPLAIKNKLTGDYLLEMYVQEYFGISEYQYHHLFSSFEDTQNPLISDVKLSDKPSHTKAIKHFAQFYKAVSLELI